MSRIADPKAATDVAALSPTSAKCFADLESKVFRHASGLAGSDSLASFGNAVGRGRDTRWRGQPRGAESRWVSAPIHLQLSPGESKRYRNRKHGKATWHDSQSASHGSPRLIGNKRHRGLGR